MKTFTGDYKNNKKCTRLVFFLSIKHKFWILSGIIAFKNIQLSKDAQQASFSCCEETSDLICYVSVSDEDKHVSL